MLDNITCDLVEKSEYIGYDGADNESSFKNCYPHLPSSY